MDEIRSSPVMVLVTYPRAPARITEPTSCGESDTDSARNAEAGESGCDLARISAPPPPSPPGTCTSSSTTSGLMSAIIAIEPSTSAACPTMWKYGCSVAMTPARNISWSSTTATRIGVAAASRGVVSVSVALPDSTSLHSTLPNSPAAPCLAFAPDVGPMLVLSA